MNPKCSRNKPTVRLKPSVLRFRHWTIEKTFADYVIDLKEVVVLEGIDILGYSENRARRRAVLVIASGLISTTAWRLSPECPPARPHEGEAAAGRRAAATPGTQRHKSMISMVIASPW